MMILLVDQEPVSEVVPLHDQPGGGHVNLVEDEGNKNNCHQQTENIIFVTFVLLDNRETSTFDHEACICFSFWCCLIFFSLTIQHRQLKS